MKQATTGKIIKTILLGTISGESRYHGKQETQRSRRGILHPREHFKNLLDKSTEITKKRT